MDILLVKDDHTIATGLEYSLKQELFNPLLCYDATSRVEIIEK